MSAAPLDPDRVRHAPCLYLPADDSTGSHRRASESFDFTLNGNRAERVQIVNVARERVLAMWRRRQSLALRLQGLGAARHVFEVDAA
jgi:hypothetical protein